MLLPSIDESRSATPALLPYDASAPHSAAAVAALTASPDFCDISAGGGLCGHGGGSSGGCAGLIGGGAAGITGAAAGTDLFDFLEAFDQESQDFWPPSRPAGKQPPAYSGDPICFVFSTPKL